VAVTFRLIAPWSCRPQAFAECEPCAVTEEDQGHPSNEGPVKIHRQNRPPCRCPNPSCSPGLQDLLGSFLKGLWVRLASISGEKIPWSKRTPRTRASPFSRSKRATQAEGIGLFAHRGNTEGDVFVEGDTQLLCTLDDVVAADAASERSVLHAFFH
jgi:hypothetical protein